MGNVRISLPVGNAIQVVGLIFASFIILVASGIGSIPTRFFLYLVGWASLLFFPHCLAHYLMGRLLGLHFKYYRVGRSSLVKLKIPVLSSIAGRMPVLTLKVDSESMRVAGTHRSTVMFASGAIASISLPFIAFAASIKNLPPVLSSIIGAITLGNLFFDLYYSSRAGDLSRAFKVTRWHSEHEQS